MVGKTISHYKIIEEIGSGGMGMVYKAEDTKLNRTVALKFLPPELTHNQESKERFIREAHAASTLENDNICTIHEIDETDDGQLFIVMACYEGQTLKEKIKDQRLKIKEAVNITTQIAKGLQKAHDKGIVHRDIKPANIFITDDGSIKILDFGLAKLSGQTQLTKDSSTLGTVSYMSPEQLRGEEIDHRTDIWSLGVILYEMLTGELPFKGDYEQAVIYSILNNDPQAVTAVRPDIPTEVAEVINKALIKNPDERHQNINEMPIALKAHKKEQFVKEEAHKIFPVIPRALQYILIIVLVIASVSTVYILIRAGENKVFQIRHTSPLTTGPGLEQDPTWSPDGTRIAYTSDETGNMDIWILQITGGQRINLTKDYTGYDGKPAWSPNGEWIAFVSQRDGGGIFLISALGGIPKRILSLSFAPSLSYFGAIPSVHWSPDGSELAYATSGILYTIPVSGGIPVPMPLPPSGLVSGYSEPVWSFNGERIACTNNVATGVSTSQIWTVKYDGTDPVPLTEGKNFDCNPVWSPNGKQLFFISDRGGSRDIWWIPVDDRGKPTANARPLTAGVGVGSIILSKDGTKLIYTKMVERSNICSIPLMSGRTLSLDDALMITSENQYIEQIYVSPDKDWIAFDSNRSGNTDIWVMRKNGSELRQLTTNTAHDWVGPWSPDGSHIAFHSLRYGNRDLFVMPVSGGAVKRLTNHPAEDFICDWSPDGKQIAFTSNRSGNMDVWTIPSMGGKPQQLTFHKAREGGMRWSPDGKRFVFNSTRTGHEELFLMPADGGEPVQLTHEEWLGVSPGSWSPDGQTIYACGHSNQGTNLWAVSVKDGVAHPLMDFRGSLKEPIAGSCSDGERLYFTLWECRGDIWMAELEKNE